MKILKYIGYGFGVLLLLVVVLIIAMPSQFTIVRKATIKAPKKVVYERVIYFKNFPKWSPWQDFDPKMTTSIKGEDGKVGAVYEWSGNDSVGKGTQSITAVTEERIDLDLHFITPFESHSKTDYVVKAISEVETEITWTLHTSLPRPLNIFGPIFNLEESVGKDYERGLTKLKTLCETYVAENYRGGFEIVEFDFPERLYVVKKGSIKMTEIEKFYGVNFSKAVEEIKKANLLMTTPPTGLYWVWDEAKGMVEMAAGFGATGEVKGLETVKIPAQKAYKIAFYGPSSGTMKAHLAMDEYFKAKGFQQGLPVMEEYAADATTEKDSTKWLTNVVYFKK
ncbi:MAG: SRPBCC family protein [Chloroherpetonaceae bacterium]|nr:SRPBCC family protein [Chloroherpetonaceae bacterium]